MESLGPELDISAMAQETWNLVYEEQPSPVTIKAKQFPFIAPPQRPGILFYIEKGKGTFCIRGKPSEDLFKLYEELEEYGSDKLSEIFKFRSVIPQIDQIDFFVTKRLDQAEVISEQILNRRFPYCEDVVCNLTDPGLSWWFENDDNNLKIHLSTPMFDSAKNIEKLGPLGDKKMSVLRFHDLVKLIEKLYPLQEATVSDKGLNIISDDEELLYILTQWFRHGEEPFKILQHVSDFEPLKCFIDEVSLVRQLWVRIEESVGNESKTSRKNFAY